jgi:hypothetical protein
MMPMRRSPRLRLSKISEVGGRLRVAGGRLGPSLLQYSGNSLHPPLKQGLGLGIGSMIQRQAQLSVCREVQ